jgi:hypothetical protein
MNEEAGMKERARTTEKSSAERRRGPPGTPDLPERRGFASSAICSLKGEPPGCPWLPLEVLGPADTTVEATVHLADPSQVQSLRMQFREHDNETKASVSLTGGAFVGITNKSVTVLGTAN